MATVTELPNPPEDAVCLFHHRLGWGEHIRTELYIQGTPPEYYCFSYIQVGDYKRFRTYKCGVVDFVNRLHPKERGAVLEKLVAEHPELKAEVSACLL